MKRIVIFASGRGTNANQIISYFKKSSSIKVVGLFCNNAQAAAIQVAEQNRIPVTVFKRDEFYNHDIVLNKLKALEPDLIVLAGFLWLIPKNILQQFPKQILNIHPSLLPAHGGEGMYGMRVHQSVIENHETYSGITIHFIDEEFDRGQIIFQAKLKLDELETAESLSKKINALELKHFAPVIESVLLAQVSTL